MGVIKGFKGSLISDRVNGRHSRARAARVAFLREDQAIWRAYG